MGGGAWWATVHGVTKSQIRLSDLTFASKEAAEPGFKPRLPDLEIMQCQLLPPSLPRQTWAANARSSCHLSHGPVTLLAECALSKSEPVTVQSSS